MDFKRRFIELTKWTVPFGWEYTLEPLLPMGWKKDPIGNYYYEIGDSKTLFTGHLDTASKERERVNHIIDGDIIKTDGTTILGGDNKAGCLVMIYLIERGIPGTYYFFLGEEMSVHSNYPYGSLLAIENRGDYFKKFDRVVSFDRKERDQLITRQLGRTTCSPQFVDSLIGEFSKFGINYKEDKTGYYTDSAFFMDIIPEVVNLSVGVWNEHLKTEWVDIGYVERVARAASKINWESLPTFRKIESKYEFDTRGDYSGDLEISQDAQIFSKIFEILDDLYFVCHEFRSYQNYLYNFKSGRKYNFTRWHQDDHLEISVNGGVIISNGFQYETLESFKKSIGMEEMDSDEFSKLMLSEFIKNGDKLTDAQFNYLMTLKNGDPEKLKVGLKKLGYELIQIGKGYMIKGEDYIIKSFEGFRIKFR